MKPVVFIGAGPGAADLITVRGAQRLAQADVVLTSYPLLWRDAMALQRQPWHIVILDEAQRIKNWSSKTAQAVKRLRSRFAFVLTGTPIENHLRDLWSIFEFLNPGMLGQLQAGKEPLSMAAHETVTERLGISRIHLAREVAQRHGEPMLGSRSHVAAGVRDGFCARSSF